MNLFSSKFDSSPLPKLTLSSKTKATSIFDNLATSVFVCYSQMRNTKTNDINKVLFAFK